MWCVGKNGRCHMAPCIGKFGYWLYDRSSSRTRFAFFGWSHSSSVQLYPCFTGRSAETPKYLMYSPSVHSRMNPELRCYHWQVCPYSANFPIAWVLSLALFWCLVHYLNDLKAVNGVALHPANDVEIEYRLTICPKT